MYHSEFSLQTSTLDKSVKVKGSGKQSKGNHIHALARIHSSVHQEKQLKWLHKLIANLY